MISMSTTTRQVTSLRDGRSAVVGMEVFLQLLDSLPLSHSKYPKPGSFLLHTSPGRGPQSHADIIPRLRGQNDAIVPKTSTAKSGLTFVLDSFSQTLITLPYSRHNSAQLLRSHNRSLRIRPRPQESRRVSSSTHAVVSCAGAGTKDDCEFGNVGACHGRYQFCTVLGYPACFSVATHHEA